MNIQVQEFPNEVIGKLQFYVYRLIDPRNGDTFYVGKGKGNRVFQHIKGILSDNDFDVLPAKMKTIHNIHTAGLEVIHVIHRHNMSETTAREVEAALIDAYPGSTNIQGGIGSNDFGPMNAQELINRYAAEEAQIAHKVLMITINRSASELATYQATRFAWKLKKSKAEQAEYVLAVVQGVIVEVFKPTIWKVATEINFPEFGEGRPDRIGFEGGVAEDIIRDQYLNKRVPDQYRKPGAANPVKYSF